MQIHEVVADLFHADRRIDGRTDGRSVGRTDGYDEANNRFRNLANASKMARSSYLKITDRGK